MDGDGQVLTELEQNVDDLFINYLPENIKEELKTKYKLMGREMTISKHILKDKRQAKSFNMIANESGNLKEMVKDKSQINKMLEIIDSKVDDTSQLNKAERNGQRTRSIVKST